MFARDSERNMKATDSEHIGKSNLGEPESLGEDHHSVPWHQSDTILKSLVEHPNFVANNSYTKSLQMQFTTRKRPLLQTQSKPHADLVSA